jgi:hypothetical protein
VSLTAKLEINPHYVNYRAARSLSGAALGAVDDIAKWCVACVSRACCVLWVLLLHLGVSIPDNGAPLALATHSAMSGLPVASS